MAFVERPGRCARACMVITLKLLNYKMRRGSGYLIPINNINMMLNAIASCHHIIDLSE
jgi:hypothetical protein